MPNDKRRSDNFSIKKPGFEEKTKKPPTPSTPPRKPVNPPPQPKK